MKYSICPQMTKGIAPNDIVHCDEGTGFGDKCQAWSEELQDCKLFPSTLDLARLSLDLREALEELMEGKTYKQMWGKLRLTWESGTTSECGKAILDNMAHLEKTHGIAKG